MKQICRQHLKYSWNCEIGCARVENIFGKGENADNQCFLLSPQCFQSDSPSGYSNSAMRSKVLTLSPIYTRFNTLKKKASGKHCGKR